MSVVARQSHEQSMYTRIPILSPEQIEKLNSFNFKVERKQCQNTVKSSLRTRGDQVTQEQTKNSRKFSKEFEDLFRNKIGQKNQKSNPCNQNRNQSQRHCIQIRLKSYQNREKQQNSYVSIQGQQLSAAVCCSMFQGQKRIKDNPFLVARMQMANK